MKSLAIAAMRACLVLGATGLLGCPEDNFTGQVGSLTVTPILVFEQVELDNPVGIDFGEVPIDSPDTATFEIANVSNVVIDLESIEILAADDVELTAELFVDNRRAELPLQLRTASTDDSTARLVVTATTRADDGLPFSGRVGVQTNAGENEDDVLEVQVQGIAKFIGLRNLEIVYGSDVYALPEDCTADPTDDTICVLPTLDFGNITLASSATSILTLRNRPQAGTCERPDLDSGEPDCRPACLVTFDRLAPPAGTGLGIGFLGDPEFGISGETQPSDVLPMSIAPPKDGCPSNNADLDLKLKFEAAPTPDEHAGFLVLESDDPDAARVHIPLLANSREGPTAIAEIRECGATNPEPACTVSTEIEPLTRVFLDGRDSFDGNGLSIIGYHWELVSVPEGANPAFEAYEPQPPEANTALFSMFVPLAGDYTVRLRVTNSDGVQSGVGGTSEVSFEAVPKSRVHVQLVWDDPQNDQDLHLTVVGDDGKDYVYHESTDCFWDNCRPEYLADPDHDKAIFAPGDPPGELGNPRLDVDKTAGIGPENINVDAPHPGRYRLYVHYYGLENPSLNTPTECTVRIYLDGTLRREFRQTLVRDDLWAVAEIVWNDSDTGTVVNPQVGADTIVPLTVMPARNEGYEFTPSPF